MTHTPSKTRSALQTLALLGLLAAGGAWGQTRASCASLSAAANALVPGAEQRVREKVMQSDTDFLRSYLAKIKPIADQDAARLFTVCVFEHELAARSGSSVAATAPPVPPRDDPKVFGRSARGG